MFQPTRRNRNIGTAKQGYGKDNKLTISFSVALMQTFYERLVDYKVVERNINGKTFRFVVERTRKNAYHACTIDDIVQILTQIPINDFGDLDLIVLRQPKRKEEILSPVWGRLVYSYEFENDYSPAIIIEAIDLARTFKRTKKLSVDAQKELERLKEDGHKITIGKRYYEAKYEIENIRNTQLYRTLPHEIGHYVHYLETVERPLSYIKEKLEILDAKIDDEDTVETNEYFNEWDALYIKYEEKQNHLSEQYFAIPTSEKEVFAHTYADKLKSTLVKADIVPFKRILNEKSILDDGLSIDDFQNS